MLRGGSGEAVQMVIHGPGFVAVQSYEWSNPRSDSQGGGLSGTRPTCSAVTGLDDRSRARDASLPDTRPPAAHCGQSEAGGAPVSGVEMVFVAVVGARFVLPLFIPRWPLPAIIACLVLDGIDQSIFQGFGYDPPGYQSYDKAMDVFYLAIAYLATLRNWQSLPAFRVARFLYFYRLVGVVAFELTQVRALLLVFPNTFEYFFIAYEAIRSRWSTVRLVLHGWVVWPR